MVIPVGDWNVRRPFAVARSRNLGFGAKSRWDFFMETSQAVGLRTGIVEQLARVRLKLAEPKSAVGHAGRRAVLRLSVSAGAAARVLGATKRQVRAAALCAVRLPRGGAARRERVRMVSI